MSRVVRVTCRVGSTGGWPAGARSVAEPRSRLARIGFAARPAHCQSRAADDASLRNRPRHDRVRPGPQWTPAQPKTVDTAMAAHPIPADEPAARRYLVECELDEPRFRQSDDDGRPLLTRRPAVTSETEPGGLFPARLGSPLTGPSGAPADPRRPGLTARLGRRRQEVRDCGARRWNTYLPRRRDGRGRDRGRRRDGSRHRRHRHRHRRQCQSRKRDRRRRQGGSGRRPAPGRRDDQQGGVDGSAP